MKRLTQVLRQFKQWILSIVIVSLTKQAFDFSLFTHRLKRRDNSKTYAAIFNIRISFMKNYRYISINLTRWIHLKIQFYN